MFFQDYTTTEDSYKNVQWKYLVDIIQSVILILVNLEMGEISGLIELFLSKPSLIITYTINNFFRMSPIFPMLKTEGTLNS